MTKAEIRTQWEERVAAFRASGLGVAAWCTANHVKPHQLWYWLRKEKLVATPAETAPRWLSVEIGDLRTGCQGDGLLIRVGHAVVEVQPGFNPALLSDVLRVVTALC